MDAAVKNFGMKTWHVATGIAVLALSIAAGIGINEYVIRPMINKSKTTAPAKSA